MLRSYGIGEPKSVQVHTPEDLRRLERIEFPVACKLLAQGVLHKTEVGGVVLDVSDFTSAESLFGRFRKLAKRKGLRFEGMLVQEMVEDGVELILGGTRDLTFGPVVILGLGGTFAELVREYTLAVAPVTPKQVGVMLAKTKLARVLEGYRGGPKPKIDSLSRVVSDFSKIMVDNPTIDQMELNPLIATEDRALSVDARVILGQRRALSWVTGVQKPSLRPRGSSSRPPTGHRGALSG